LRSRTPDLRITRISSSATPCAPGLSVHVARHTVRSRVLRCSVISCHDPCHNDDQQHDPGVGPLDRESRDGWVVVAALTAIRAAADDPGAVLPLGQRLGEPDVVEQLVLRGLPALLEPVRPRRARRGGSSGRAGRASTGSASASRRRSSVESTNGARHGEDGGSFMSPVIT
jgi:hypothetical protein